MTFDLETKLSSLAGAFELIHAPDGSWLDAPNLNVVEMADLFLKIGLRLTTVTGIALEDGETQLIYHFMDGGTVLNVKVHTKKNAIASITSIMPSADWIEREIHDLYAVEFLGHPHLDRLVRPPELPIGFFREKGGEAGKQQRAQTQTKVS